MRIVTGTFVCVALTVGVACAEEPSASADLTVVTLMKRALERDFTPNREVLVDLVEIPPNTTLDRHWHPGEEFHYYLEGEVEIAIDGEPSIKGKPGTVGHVPYRKLHTAITGDGGAKILVFRVHSKGEPMRYLEGEGSGRTAGQQR
jgi:quercetin dioxygenase-like cupin family protein